MVFEGPVGPYCVLTKRKVFDFTRVLTCTPCEHVDIRVVCRRWKHTVYVREIL